ncbi:Rap1a/Tai family immunity protein [Rhizobium sp. BE258]|uniref:Rap1a/Tai family immunity protein n=1 Tax=Rhizobium sp. BE258 TaxID=2817722 RepID=UPI00285E0305|nr:Rap1a/Tai family immunity protein [Rhizobium sp. BE258]MDR7145552.1 hypothetical protein [Rhizobium sp. BE258]
MKWLGLLVLTSLFPATACAFTGAELIQADKSFATGYVFGVVEYQTGVLDNDDPDFMKVRNCVINARMTAGTFYDVSVQYFRTHPKALTEPAFGGIIKAMKDMCQ